MSAKQGIDAFLGRNTGTYGTPVWSELTCVVEVTPNNGWNAAEIKTRASRVILGAKVNIDIAYTFRVLCDDTDAGYTALMTAFRSLTATIDLLCLDGDVATIGAFGVRFEAQITEGAQPQPPDDVLYRTFRAVPYPTTNPPKYAEVTTGPVITYTTI